VRLILASASPRRRELLERLGVPFMVWPSGVEEPLAPEVPASALAATLARAKAGRVADQVRAAGGPPAVVLGADTLVVVDGRPLGKPVSRDDARRMLRTLRGRGHEVVTGVALLGTADGREAVEVVTSPVVMRAYGEPEIEAYVATGEASAASWWPGSRAATRTWWGCRSARPPGSSARSACRRSTLPGSDFDCLTFLAPPTRCRHTLSDC
jgi:septum formation protein